MIWVPCEKCRSLPGIVSPRIVPSEPQTERPSRSVPSPPLRRAGQGASSSSSTPPGGFTGTFASKWEVFWSPGPSPRAPRSTPSKKRLAGAVEDHPLDYAEFEGMIPAGNYGAGAVIVWDQGLWTPIENPANHRERGKLLFDFHGYKLRGR